MHNNVSQYLYPTKLESSNFCMSSVHARQQTNVGCSTECINVVLSVDPLANIFGCQQRSNIVYLLNSNNELFCKKIINSEKNKRKETISKISIL